MKRTDLAYLAGVIDSDGTIGIKKNSYSRRVIGDSTQDTYSERICVKQVEPFAVDLLHAIFGGYRFIADPNAKRGKPLHGWQVTDLKAIATIKAIRPFMRIKHRQADVCLELRRIKTISKKVRVAKGRGHVGGGYRPIELTDKMESLKVAINALNKVGV